MSRIEQMNLKLPATHRDRAAEIAQRVSAGIAKIDIGRSRSIRHLVIPPISIARDAAEDELVQSIVGAIRTSLVNQK
jgi:hypothetical protein